MACVYVLCVGNVGRRIMEIDVDEGEWKVVSNGEEHGWRVKTWSLWGILVVALTDIKKGTFYTCYGTGIEKWKLSILSVSIPVHEPI